MEIDVFKLIIHWSLGMYSALLHVHFLSKTEGCIPLLVWLKILMISP